MRRPVLAVAIVVLLAPSWSRAQGAADSRYLLPPKAIVAILNGPYGRNGVRFLDVKKPIRAKGVEFTDGIRDVGYGLATHFRVPGGFQLELYQPSYRKR